MNIQSAEVTKEGAVVVLSGLKSIYGPHSPIEAYATDARGQKHALSPEALDLLEPEIRSYVDRFLSPRIQRALATLGAHVRLTAEEEKAALLFDIYRNFPND